MNEEAVKTEENDDELWAFKWAQERKLRMKMELRLKGAIFEIGCLAGIAEETIKYLSQNNEKEVARRLPTFIDFIFDAQNHIRLNLLSMLWEELDEHEKQYFLDASKQSDIPQHVQDKVDEIIVAGGNACAEEYAALCEEKGMLCVDNQRQKYRTEYLVAGLSTFLATHSPNKKLAEASGEIMSIVKELARQIETDTKSPKN